jgi:hypothetical protein
MARKIPLADWDAVRARFQGGETITSIARSYDCSGPAIHYILGRIGCGPAPRAYRQKGSYLLRHPGKSPLQLGTEIIRERSREVSWKELSARTGYSIARLKQLQAQAKEAIAAKKIDTL